MRKILAAALIALGLLGAAAATAASGGAVTHGASASPDTYHHG
jgi:hypothetical protein